MVFFFSDNPIALFLTLVVVLVVLKLALGKHKWFKGDKAAYIVPIMIIAAIFLIAYSPAIRMLSIIIPFFIVLVMFLFAIVALMYVFGMPTPQIWPQLKEIGILRVGPKIAIICIIAFAASQVFGDRLLEDKTVSFADSIVAEEEPVKVDFSPLFTKHALGLIVLIAVLGLAFVFVNIS